MKRSFIAHLICVILISGLSAQTEQCLYFPLAKGKTWTYVNSVYSDTLVAEVTDTVTINKKLYYIYAPYGKGNYDNWPRYRIRPEAGRIFALNMQDLSEYLLFDFTAENGTSWAIPPDSGSVDNQCNWGSKITIYSDRDSLQATERVFYRIRQFSHSEKPCADAGIETTFFALDFGPVRIYSVTVAGVIDWELVTTADTITIKAQYTTAGNPCLTVPCLPGVVSAIRYDGANYFLTQKERMYSDGIFSWYGYTPVRGDSVRVTGIPTQRTDANGKIYYTIEVLDFEKIDVSGLKQDENLIQPGGFYLEQNYPNPFNPETLIRYEIPFDSPVTMHVIDPAGHMVAVLVNRVQEKGRHEVRFDARNLASGIYFCVLQAGEQRATRKMVLIK